MPNSQPPTNFEVPLYKKPSDHLKNFMEKLERISTNCCAMYRNNKLTFFATSSEKASLTPCSKKHPRKEEIIKGLSIFASKFNATCSVVAKDEATMDIEFFDADSEAKESYGEDVICILRVTVTCNELAARTVLADFYKMLDTYGNWLNQISQSIHYKR